MKRDEAKENEIFMMKNMAANGKIFFLVQEIFFTQVLKSVAFIMKHPKK